MMPAHNNFMIAKFTAQMRPRARGSQRVTKEHNSFIGASITHSELKVETSEIKEHKDALLLSLSCHHDSVSHVKTSAL